MDFSTMAAASKDIFHEDEHDLHRRRRSPSQASSTLSRRLGNSPQTIGGRRLTIGSEMKRDHFSTDFSRTPGAPSRLQPQNLPIFPTSSVWSGDVTSAPSVTSSNAPSNTTDFFNPWGTLPTTTQEVNRPIQNDPLSLSHLGLNLDEASSTGPLFGNTMFSGPEFNLWSSGSIFQPPTSTKPPADEKDQQ
uniref:Uncharacterized protein n=2 Tax=Caenorhabditis japonica TaxID=281687 RepID=A0A8R1E652_CAEJA